MTSRLNDYAGPLIADAGLAHLSRTALAALGREYMLFGHLLTRGALAYVHMKMGAQVREDVAIEEWMGASPIYTQRMQRSLGFTGDGVATIFKGLQLDVGFAHQYMDVRYELESDRCGFFWLQHCGALLEVEPFGDAAVRSMCHAIEDPTFDATAVATNPRARIRPVHRPPRTPADRVPHCRWEVAIDPAAEPIHEIDLTRRVRASRLACCELAAPPEDGGGGWPDYSRPFEPDFHLELLSHAALVRVCGELLVQDHLLVRSLMITLTDRAGADTAAEIATAQWIGAGAVASRRLLAALQIGGDGAEAILKVLQFHPAFLAGYTSLGVELLAVDRGRFWLADSDALQEGDGYSWFALLGAAPHPALDAMVQAVNPRARCIPVTPPRHARLAWEVVVDATTEPAPEPPEVGIVANSGTARFAFSPRRVPANAR
jgi:hypothetical protein